jgi:hypothetical protein
MKAEFTGQANLKFGGVLVWWGERRCEPKFN